LTSSLYYYCFIIVSAFKTWNAYRIKVQWQSNWMIYPILIFWVRKILTRVSLWKLGLIMPNISSKILLKLNLQYNLSIAATFEICLNWYNARWFLNAGWKYCRKSGRSFVHYYQPALVAIFLKFVKLVAIWVAAIERCDFIYLVFQPLVYCHFCQVTMNFSFACQKIMQWQNN